MFRVRYAKQKKKFYCKNVIKKVIYMNLLMIIYLVCILGVYEFLQHVNKNRAFGGSFLYQKWWSWLI